MPRAIREVLRKRERDKYVDPEVPWCIRDDEAGRNFVESGQMGLWDGSLELLRFFPEGRELSSAGGWISVIRPPHTLIKTSFGDSFYAEAYTEALAYGWSRYQYSITAHTPDGQLRLWPYEYAVLPVEELARASADGEMVFHPMKFEEAAFAEKLFYLHTRGIPTEVALPMIIGEVLSPVGYFTLAK